MALAVENIVFGVALAVEDIVFGVVLAVEDIVFVVMALTVEGIVVFGDVVVSSYS